MGLALATSDRHGNGIAEASLSHGLESITVCKNNCKSSYEFVRGPATAGNPGDPRLEMNACPPLGTLAVLGLKPYVPQHIAGIRIEPLYREQKVSYDSGDKEGWKGQMIDEDRHKTS